MQGAEKISQRCISYGVYVSKKFIPQRSSWDEIWIFRGALQVDHEQAVVSTHCLGYDAEDRVPGRGNKPIVFR